MAPPHPVLTIQTAVGGRWQVDLGNPSQTKRSGLTGSTAQVGDAITVRGNRSKDAQAQHMKAVHITGGGQNYDIYPSASRTEWPMHPALLEALHTLTLWPGARWLQQSDTAYLRVNAAHILGLQEGAHRAA